jgi:CRISPR/Cas system-associated endoribonuclease Cas2
MAHLIVVSYDIPDDRRRLRLAHALKDFGVRVQYSVFECHLEPDGLDSLRWDCDFLTFIVAFLPSESVRIALICMVGLRRPLADPGRRALLPPSVA